MRNISLLLLAIFLSGCGHYMQAKDTQKEVLECKRKWDEREFKKAVDEAKCMNDAWAKYTLATNDPNSDVIMLLNAHRMQLAKKIDAGKISKEDAEEDMAKFAADQGDRIRNRNAIQQTSNAAQTQASGALLQGVGVLNQSMQPRTPTTCVSNGPFTTCR